MTQNTLSNLQKDTIVSVLNDLRNHFINLSDICNGNAEVIVNGLTSVEDFHNLVRDNVCAVLRSSGLSTEGIISDVTNGALRAVVNTQKDSTLALIGAVDVSVLARVSSNSIKLYNSLEMK